MYEIKKEWIFSLKTNVMIALLLLTQQSYASGFAADLQNPEFSFGWNKAIGICAGYSRIYKNFESDYYAVTPPQNLVCVDANLYGIYMGIAYGVRDTGYSVYGYSEQLSSWNYKIGISFNLNHNYSKWRYTITPYVGKISYSLDDTSNNDIGAREEYGTKESSFLVGCKLAAIYKEFCIGIHCSNKEFGFSLGFEYNLN